MVLKQLLLTKKGHQLLDPCCFYWKTGEIKNILKWWKQLCSHIQNKAFELRCKGTFPAIPISKLIKAPITSKAFHLCSWVLKAQEKLLIAAFNLVQHEILLFISPSTNPGLSNLWVAGDWTDHTTLRLQVTQATHTCTAWAPHTSKWAPSHCPMPVPLHAMLHSPLPSYSIPAPLWGSLGPPKPSSCELPKACRPYHPALHPDCNRQWKWRREGDPSDSGGSNNRKAIGGNGTWTRSREARALGSICSL